MRFRACTLVTILTVVCSSGCVSHLKDWCHNGFKVGPDYCKPGAPVADAWIDEYDERVKLELPANEAWWVEFKDPQLSELVFTAYQQNLTLREAGLRVLQARAQRGVAVGGLFPQSQAAFGEFARTLDSREVFGASATGPRAFDNWATGLDMTWELDVWGRFRRNIEAADADLESTVENYDDILVVLLAETATTYVNYRTLQERIDYLKENIQVQEGSLRIANVRFKDELTSELDVKQAEQSLATTRELVPQLENQLRIANNNLCVLLGRPPVDLASELGEQPIPVPPPTVAVGVPANLLRRRPDVRRAEREAAAESARIGVATADLFPSFSIQGAIQYEAQNFSDLFRGSANAGAITPGFRWDILNYGRLVNNIRAQDAVFQQKAVAYQQAVLSANAEAENAINSFLKSQERLIQSRVAADAAKRALELATTQYRRGLIDFINVFTLQETLVQRLDDLATAQGDVAANLIAVYKAMGGGWQIRYGVSAIASPFVGGEDASGLLPSEIPIDPPPVVVAPDAPVELPPPPADDEQ